MVKEIKQLIYFKKVFMSNLDDHGVGTGLNFAKNYCLKSDFQIVTSWMDIIMCRLATSKKHVWEQDKNFF